MTLPVSSAELEPRLPLAQAAGRAIPGLSKALHWLTAALVFAMFGSGVLMKQLGDGPLSATLYTAHKTAGTCVLGLTLLRLGYRLLLQAGGGWNRKVGGHVAHGALYAMLILVPLLGWAGVSDFGARGLLFGLELPAILTEGAGHAELLFRSHAWLAFAMIGLVFVHIGIAVGDYVQRGGTGGRAPTGEEGPAGQR
ncbi:cytochrome b [Bosea sp. (in: a-proteobacteria)]|uniref:cytochrome b n=1 Tax=Bosea sp. (in: a-proteobacteria) TaxID=1871050 RepID=UPI002FC89BDC